MRLLQALLLLALAAAAAATPRRLRQAAAPAPEREATAFAVNYGGYENHVRSDDTVSGMVLLTQPGVRNPDGSGVRLLIGFPDANSGAVAYFNATQGPSADLVVKLDNTTLTSVRAGSAVGLTGTLVFDRDATLYRALVGSIRTVRDYLEGPRIVRPIFAHTTRQDGNTVVLHRDYINATGINTLEFAPADGTTQLALTPDGNFTVKLAPGAAEGRVQFTALVSWPTNLIAIPPSQLLAPGKEGIIAGAPQVTELSFLAYPQKLLAGSWRFLTYFGRDSLIAARLMMSRMAAEFTEAGIKAALANINMRQNYTQYNGQDAIPVGTLCHEETLGDNASFTNIAEGTPELGGQLWCDYKMVDTDFLLLPAVAYYFLNTSQGQGRAQQVLDAAVPSERGTALNGGRTYGELLEANANLVLDLARPFAEDPSLDNLISIRPGQDVGNWRDSQTGLAYARIIYGVNTALLPAALRAIEQLSAAGILDAGLGQEAVSLADVWEAEAWPFFQVTLPAQEAEQMVGTYAQQLGVPAPPVSEAVAGGGGNLTFMALSIHENGTKVPIMHSDPAFNLLYQDNVPEAIIRSVPALLADYPTGLLTPAGMVVSNAAYAPLEPELRDQLYANFTNGFYHGAVVWGFIEAMMVQGLERQLALCDAPSPPAWCTDAQLRDQLRRALDRLWTVIANNKDQAFSEVWSWKYEGGSYRVASLAETSATSTESNAIQLWSHAFIATPNPSGTGTLLEQ